MFKLLISMMFVLLMMVVVIMVVLMMVVVVMVGMMMAGQTTGASLYAVSASDNKLGEEERSDCILDLAR